MKLPGERLPNRHSAFSSLPLVSNYRLQMWQLYDNQLKNLGDKLPYISNNHSTNYCNIIISHEKTFVNRQLHILQKKFTIYSLRAENTFVGTISPRKIVQIKRSSGARKKESKLSLTESSSEKGTAAELWVEIFARKSIISSR